MNITLNVNETSDLTHALGLAIGGFEILSNTGEPLTEQQKLGCLQIKEKLNDMANLIHSKYVDSLVPRTPKAH
jgi:hypothetical protein